MPVTIPIIPIKERKIKYTDMITLVQNTKTTRCSSCN